MARELIPRDFFSNFRMPSLFEDEDNRFLSLLDTQRSSGLSVSEDDTHVYVEAAVPGIDPEQVEVTYDKGILWIRGQQSEQKEDQKRKFYRKASRACSYRVMIPGNIDESKEPEATYKNGVMNITFNKVAEAQPKKIAIKVNK
ncbi:MAG TPA: Hsp20/alpha crystallin family protein [Patescibacteria group bacterium]|nr:Hsp20/alpha crystallin family protein [Patescibacteria group bacterium]